MKAPKKAVAPPKFIATNRGLMKCSVEDFDPSKYKGLKQNCGRPKKETKPTN